MNLKPISIALCTGLFMASAQAALHGRDLGGSSDPDAYYDDVLQITWLADAAAAGPLSWGDAKDWADNLDVFGVRGWRLPSTTDVGNDGCTRPVDCTFSGDIPLTPRPDTSEMAHLFYETLGNTNRLSENTGPFINLNQIRDGFWSGTENIVASSEAWAFGTNGHQDPHAKSIPLFAWAVHDDDLITAIPEPGSYPLLLSGLLVLGAWTRRRQGG